MRVPRSGWARAGRRVGWITAVVVFLVPYTGAKAQVRVTLPESWTRRDGADGALAARAHRLAEALGGTVTAIASPPEADGFAELAVVIEAPGPLFLPSSDSASGEPRDPQAVATEVFGAVASPNTSFEAMAWRAQPTPVLRAEWRHDHVRVFAAAAPVGANRALLLWEVLDNEASLYRPGFERCVASLEGTGTPYVPFDRTRFSLGLLLGWLAAAGIAGAWVWQGGSRTTRHARAWQSGAALVGLGVASWPIVAALLQGREEALRVAGLAAAELGGWSAATGATMGLLCIAAAWIPRPRPRPTAPALIFVDRGAVPSPVDREAAPTPQTDPTAPGARSDEAIRPEAPASLAPAEDDPDDGRPKATERRYRAVLVPVDEAEPSKDSRVTPGA